MWGPGFLRVKSVELYSSHVFVQAEALKQVVIACGVQCAGRTECFGSGTRAHVWQRLSCSLEVPLGSAPVRQCLFVLNSSRLLLAAAVALVAGEAAAAT